MNFKTTIGLYFIPLVYFFGCVFGILFFVYGYEHEEFSGIFLLMLAWPWSLIFALVKDAIFKFKAQERGQVYTIDKI